jgi:hypothetical protein
MRERNAIPAGTGGTFSKVFGDQSGDTAFREPIGSRRPLWRSLQFRTSATNDIRERPAATSLSGVLDDGAR